MDLTPTQRKMFDLLSDGAPHSRKEMEACLWDEASTRPADAVRNQVTKLRGALLPTGLDIVVRGANGTSTYRLMRPIGPGE